MYKKMNTAKGETLVAIIMLTVSAMLLAEVTASSVRMNQTAEK